MGRIDPAALNDIPLEDVDFYHIIQGQWWSGRILRGLTSGLREHVKLCYWSKRVSYEKPGRSDRDTLCYSSAT